MKRSGPLKRSPLNRRARLRSRPQRIDRNDPARIAWKTACAGFCQCGCSAFSLHLHRHHVVERYIVVREGGSEWDMDNSMLLVPAHHMNHHSAFRRIPLSSVPDAALDFARRLLGDDRAALYLARYYSAGSERRAA